MAVPKPEPYRYGSKRRGILAGTNVHRNTLPGGSIIPRFVTPKQKVVRSNRAAYLGAQMRPTNFKAVKKGIEAMQKKGKKPWTIIGVLTKEGYDAAIDTSKNQIVVYGRYGERLKGRKSLSVPYQ